MDIPWRTAGRSCDGALRRYPFTYTKVAKKGRRRLLNTPMGCVLTNWYADGDKREGRPLSYARYEMYRTWLSFYEPTSWAMVFDFRDTFFQRDPFATARDTTAGQAGLDIPPKFRQDFQGQHGISTPRPPWRRRDLPPRTIHVAAAASLRPTPKDYPRRGRRVAATRPAPRTIHVAAAASPRLLSARLPRRFTLVDRSPKAPNLHLFAENRQVKTVGICPFNYGWLGCWGKETPKRFSNNSVVCSGSTMGSAPALKQYLLLRGYFVDGSRRRRGCDVDIPQTSRGDAADATLIFRGDE